MATKNKTQSTAKSKSLVVVDNRESTLQMLSDESTDGDFYTDIFARLMALKPKAPIAGYRLQQPKRKPS